MWFSQPIKCGGDNDVSAEKLMWFLMPVKCVNDNDVSVE